MPQAQISMWNCDYILLQSDKWFPVYCRGRPDASQSHLGKQRKPADVQYLHVNLKKTLQGLRASDKHDAEVRMPTSVARS